MKTEEIKYGKAATDKLTHSILKLGFSASLLVLLAACGSTGIDDPAIAAANQDQLDNPTEAANSENATTDNLTQESAENGNSDSASESPENPESPDTEADASTDIDPAIDTDNDAASAATSGSTSDATSGSTSDATSGATSDATSDTASETNTPVTNGAVSVQVINTALNCNANPDEVQLALLTLVNQARSQARQCGSTFFDAVPPLESSQLLQSIALSHSGDMAGNNFFSHTGSDGLEVWDRAEAVGYNYRSIAENIAAGQQTTEQAHSGWLDSPGHCANIMSSSVSEFGGACVTDSGSNFTYYWTTAFGTASGNRL